MAIFTARYATATRVCQGIRADWIRLMIAAARLPLRSDPANNQFERPSAQGRIWLST